MLDLAADSLSPQTAPRALDSGVTLIADLREAEIRDLLSAYGARLVMMPCGRDIPGSYWGDSEAGLIESDVFVRTDTPAHRKILEESGQPIPTDMAMPDEVAEVGLAQLPHGPIYNWGQPNDVAGYAPNSPDERRARIIAIEEMSAGYTNRAEEPAS